MKNEIELLRAVVDAARESVMAQWSRAKWACEVRDRLNRALRDLDAYPADQDVALMCGDDLSGRDHLPGVACDECDGGKRDVLWQHVCSLCHGTGRVVAVRAARTTKVTP
jgi:hypothetical protein